MTASRSGLGMPFFEVLPSAARPNIVSISCSNAPAGRISQVKRAGPSPAFQNLCAVRGSTVTPAPGPSSTDLRPTLKPTVPSSTSKLSDWYGWEWAAATVAPGRRTVSTSTYSPSVSAEVWWKINTSPVTGFSIVCPVRIISRSLLGQCRVQLLQPARAARPEEGGSPVSSRSGNRTRLRFDLGYDDRHGHADDRPALAGGGRARP